MPDAKDSPDHGDWLGATLAKLPDPGPNVADWLIERLVPRPVDEQGPGNNTNPHAA